MTCWAQQGSRVRAALEGEFELHAVVREWEHWLISTGCSIGQVLRAGRGVPLVARVHGEAEVDLFPLPLPPLERPPRRGRSRARWHRRCLAPQWLRILVASLNVMYGFDVPSFVQMSAAQSRLVSRLSSEVEVFLREAAVAGLSGGEGLRALLNAHLSAYDRFAHIIPLDDRAGLPSVAGTCDPSIVLQGTSLQSLAEGPEPFLLHEHE